jgi:soluble lytic murein transglycosylase
LLWFARIDHGRMVGDDHALGWEIRAAIYQQRWPLVLDAINSLTPKTANAEQWRYWKARALAATDQKDKARAIYDSLATKRSYYGYLAADRLGDSYHFNAHSLPENEAALAYVKSRPAQARARELHALGMQHYAYLEWRQLTTGLDHAQLAQAARLAFQWHWYARAIVTLAKSDYWDDLDIRYPILFLSDVRQAAANNHIDPAYILAIIRTESLFQPSARSSAGARGLMQLMPGTARRLARALGRPSPRAAQLNDPALNIKLGSRYLRDMLQDWAGNIALATASYNAGPHKVAQWLPPDAMPADIWIANITYTETRKYVKNVMSHMTVFQHRLSESVVSMEQRIDAVEPNYLEAGRTTF